MAATTDRASLAPPASKRSSKENKPAKIEADELSIAIERFPDGQEPKTEWVYAEPTEENWRKVIAQDFSNMIEMQLGLKSRGFRGCLPNPHQERKVTNLHRNLARYMGTGAPRPLV